MQRSARSKLLFTAMLLINPQIKPLSDGQTAGILTIGAAALTAIGYWGWTKYDRYRDESTISDLERFRNNATYNYQGEIEALAQSVGSNQPDGSEAQLEKISAAINRKGTDEALVQRHMSELKNDFLKAKHGEQELRKKIVQWADNPSRADLRQAAERLINDFKDLTIYLGRLDSLMRSHSLFVQLYQYNNQLFDFYSKDIACSTASDLDAVVRGKFSNPKDLYPRVLYADRLTQDLAKLEKPLAAYTIGSNFERYRRSILFREALIRTKQILVETPEYQAERVDAANHAFREREVEAKEKEAAAKMREAKAAEDRARALEEQNYIQKKLTSETARKADLLSDYKRALEEFNRNAERLLRHPDLLDSQVRQHIGILHNKLQNLDCWRA